MWEYIVILLLSVVDMVIGQSSSIPILTKASLKTAVNSWCSTSGSSAQRDAQFSTGLSGSDCSPRNKCYGPIAGKLFFTVTQPTKIINNLQLNFKVSYPTSKNNLFTKQRLNFFLFFPLFFTCPSLLNYRLGYQPNHRHVTTFQRNR